MLPREIQTEHGPEEARFDLPMRPIGALRFIGLVPMVFAIGFVWMPGQQMLRSLAEIIAGSSSGINWFFVVFLSVFVIAGMLPFCIGLFILAGRTHVTVGKDRLVVTELAGPVRWSRKVKFDQVERLEIGGAVNNADGGPGPFSSLCGVVAILKDGKKTPVAIGYPRDWLQPLVGEISSLMQRRGKAVPVQEAILLATDESGPVETEQRLEQPAGSTIELSASGAGVQLKVPSRGLWKESHGLLGFGIAWCMIDGVITASVVVGKGFTGNWVGTAAFFALFWAVGIALLLFGIHLGTRRWTMRADRSQLHIAVKSALRAREWRWTAGEIEDVRVGDSGTKVNDRTLEQLQIHARTGKPKTGLLTGRTHEELAWVATTLRGALGAQAAATTEAPPRIDPSRRRS